MLKVAYKKSTNKESIEQLGRDIVAAFERRKKISSYKFGDRGTYQHPKKEKPEA